MLSPSTMKMFSECMNTIATAPAMKVLRRDVLNARIRTCEMIDEERGLKKTFKQKRSYAHTNHYKNTICVASDFGDLPEKHQKGIIYHELGHLFAPSGDEKDADRFMFENFGIEIKYDNDLELQYV
jgi:hypothetical protein